MELSETQKKVLEILSKSPLRETFYWTGGTLLSVYYLKHRKSEDLDFFSDDEFMLYELEDFIQEIKEKLDFEKVEYKKIFDRHEFIFENSEGKLRIEFVHYNHTRKRLGERGDYQGIVIDSLDDIAANKIMAFFDRNEPKDLFDIYFLIKNKAFNVKKLLNLANQKFGISFDESSFWGEAFKKMKLLSSLTPLVSNDKEIFKKIKNYFEEGSRKFLSSRLT